MAGARNIPSPGALTLMNLARSYRSHTAECLALAGTAFSAIDRRNLIKMAADWSALADRVEKREGEAERMRPSPEPAPEPVAAQSEKPRKRRTTRKGSSAGLKVSVLRAHPTKARKSQT